MQYRGRRTIKMKTIRNNVFETNSSSTHCITLVDLEDFEKFEECEMLGFLLISVLITPFMDSLC